MTINFEDLLYNSKKIIQEIIAFLEISPTFEQTQNALNFIDPDLISY